MSTSVSKNNLPNARSRLRDWSTKASACLLLLKNSPLERVPVQKLVDIEKELVGAISDVIIALINKGQADLSKSLDKTSHARYVAKELRDFVPLIRAAKKAKPNQTNYTDLHFKEWLEVFKEREETKKSLARQKKNNLALPKKPGPKGIRP